MPPSKILSAAPISMDVLQQAATWMARLWSGDASEQDHTACAQWRAAHPDHERAWQQLDVFQQKLNCVPREVARQVLREPAVPANRKRRDALRLLGVGIVAFGAFEMLRETDVWQRARAAQSTAIGEIRQIVLPDGTQVTLASGTALDVRFDAQERVLELRAGEIFVSTAHDPAPTHRPFRVRDRHGTVEALGTRFDVRLDADSSRVKVYEGMVEVRPADDFSAAMRLAAGQGCSFDADSCSARVAVSESGESWIRGVLLAENMRVADFVTELSRYRPGLLHCSADVADLRVSGVFPLRDTDRALHNLSLVLPVSLVYRTRFWVSVEAAA